MIEKLIRELDSEDSEQAMDAQAALTSLARENDVLLDVLRALPGLSRYAQLCVIEIIEELADTRAGPALIDLLSSEFDTVREWAALAPSRRR
ncbi:hypothetical protein [Allokutzneria sp. NRRL B-24872]|uniref:hypothetical protein n=1 Tax=Allokutzneria sp. NRRL B-24872 TaxID=1137961 RepID=UPI000A36C1F1|nr:hypothetical protein [Allokutzneria sp. NRRL B-24872]